jgi:hypothetical protein
MKYIIYLLLIGFNVSYVYAKSSIWDKNWTTVKTIKAHTHDSVENSIHQDYCYKNNGFDITDTMDIDMSVVTSDAIVCRNNQIILKRDATESSSTNEVDDTESNSHPFKDTAILIKACTGGVPAVMDIQCTSIISVTNLKGRDDKIRYLRYRASIPELGCQITAQFLYPDNIISLTPTFRCPHRMRPGERVYSYIELWELNEKQQVINTMKDSGIVEFYK